SEVCADDPRPVPRQRERRAFDDLLCNRKDASGAKHRHALGARLKFMCRIGRYDLFLFVLAVVSHIVDCHGRDVTIRRTLKQKTSHDFRHAEQWRQRHPDRAIADVGARYSFGVDVGWGLLVEPNKAEGLANEFLAARCIGLNHDHRVAAGGVLDLDAVEQIGSAASGDELAQSVLRNRTRPLLAWSAYENALHGIARYLAGHTAHPGDNGAGETPSLPPGGY